MEISAPESTMVVKGRPFSVIGMQGRPPLERKLEVSETGGAGDVGLGAKSPTPVSHLLWAEVGGASSMERHKGSGWWSWGIGVSVGRGRRLCWGCGRDNSVQCDLWPVIAGGWLSVGRWETT